MLKPLSSPLKSFITLFSFNKWYNKQINSLWEFTLFRKNNQNVVHMFQEVAAKWTNTQTFKKKSSSEFVQRLSSKGNTICPAFLRANGTCPKSLSLSNFCGRSAEWGKLPSWQSQNLAPCSRSQGHGPRKWPSLGSWERWRRPRLCWGTVTSDLGGRSLFSPRSRSDQSCSLQLSSGRWGRGHRSQSGTGPQLYGHRRSR